MINNKTKMYCLLAITLSISGCGGGGGDNENAEIIDPLIISDDALNTGVTTTTEVTSSIDISDSIATPVPSVSSGQMDAFINNPLVSVIPVELNGGTAGAYSANFVTNPLVQ